MWRFKTGCTGSVFVPLQRLSGGRRVTMDAGNITSMLMYGPRMVRITELEARLVPVETELATHR